jgi:hypothetical protein
MPEFERYSPGDPPTFPAATVNGWQDAARDFYARKGGRTASPSLTEVFDPANLVLVRNDTGAARVPFSVLKPSGVLVDPATYPHDVRRRPAFSGVAPAAATDPFLVTIDPLADGQIGRAAAAGVVVCQVNVTDATHGYAQPAAGDPTGLASASGGPAQILYKPTGTGVKTCVVLLGLAPPPGFSGIHVYQSSPTTIADNTSTNLVFNSVRYNVGNYTSLASSTGSIRVNEAGYYLIGAQWWCHLTAAGGRWVKIASSLYTEYIAGQGNTDGGTGLLETQLNASIVWKAAANESFGVTVFQNSGVSMTPSSGRVAEFWINKLG